MEFGFYGSEGLCAGIGVHDGQAGGFSHSREDGGMATRLRLSVTARLAGAAGKWPPARGPGQAQLCSVGRTTGGMMDVFSP